MLAKCFYTSWTRPKTAFCRKWTRKNWQWTTCWTASQALVVVYRHRACLVTTVIDQSGGISWRLDFVPWDEDVYFRWCCNNRCTWQTYGKINLHGISWKIQPRTIRWLLNVQVLQTTPSRHWWTPWTHLQVFCCRNSTSHNKISCSSPRTVRTAAGYECCQFRARWSSQAEEKSRSINVCKLFHTDFTLFVLYSLDLASNVIWIAAMCQRNSLTAGISCRTRGSCNKANCFVQAGSM